MKQLGPASSKIDQRLALGVSVDELDFILRSTI